MTLGIMQPYIFPYIGYFQLINAVDKFILLDDVSYIKKGWINRNKVLVNGEPSTFTIPLEKASQNRLIKDIQIQTERKWRNKLLKTLDLSYRHAPYFKSIYPLLRDILNADEPHISGFVKRSLDELLPRLGIECEIGQSTGRYGNEHLKAQDRILDICLQEGAGCYLNPMGGRDMYHPGKFSLQGVKLGFLRPALPVYKQRAKQFRPGLSVIDVLMYNSPDQCKAMAEAATTDISQKEIHSNLASAS